MLFPVEKLMIENSEFVSNGGLLSVEIHLQTFEYFDGDATETAKTSVILDNIDLSGLNAYALSGTTKTFPVNPEDGYIDGSVYIQHAHHPVDVFEIVFGKIVGDSLELRFSANLALSFEGLGEYKDTVWSFELLVPINFLGTDRS